MRSVFYINLTSRVTVSVRCVSTDTHKVPSLPTQLASLVNAVSYNGPTLNQICCKLFSKVRRRSGCTYLCTSDLLMRTNIGRLALYVSYSFYHGTRRGLSQVTYFQRHVRRLNRIIRSVRLNFQSYPALVRCAKGRATNKTDALY